MSVLLFLLPGSLWETLGKTQLSFDLPRELCPRSGLVASLHKASIWQQIWRPRHKWWQTIFWKDKLGIFSEKVQKMLTGIRPFFQNWRSRVVDPQVQHAALWNPWICMNLLETATDFRKSASLCSVKALVNYGKFYFESWVSERYGRSLRSWFTLG